MNKETRSDTHVILIVDPFFGDRLLLHVNRGACWVRESDSNHGSIASVRRSAPAPDFASQVDVTSFQAALNEPPEAIVMRLLPVLELHHGPLSKAVPWESLEVFGAHISQSVKEALSEAGFTSVHDTPEGFTTRKGTRAA